MFAIDRTATVTEDGTVTYGANKGIIYNTRITKDVVITKLAEGTTIIDNVKYNDKLMDELEALIAKNKKQQENLNAKKKQLEKSKEALINQKLKLDADSAALKAGVPSAFNPGF